MLLLWLSDIAWKRKRPAYQAQLTPKAFRQPETRPDLFWTK